MMNLVKSFLKDEEGATAVEYAMLVVLIIIAALTGITALGTGVNTKFSSIASTVSK
jgi:pilus assembly protein Flp/PilA